MFGFRSSGSCAYAVSIGSRLTRSVVVKEIPSPLYTVCPSVTQMRSAASTRMETDSPFNAMSGAALHVGMDPVTAFATWPAALTNQNVSSDPSANDAGVMASETGPPGTVHVTGESTTPSVL